MPPPLVGHGNSKTARVRARSWPATLEEGGREEEGPCVFDLSLSGQPWAAEAEGGREKTKTRKQRGPRGPRGRTAALHASSSAAILATAAACALRCGPGLDFSKI